MVVGPVPGAEFPLDKEHFSIGRSEEATISINHSSISRMHAELIALGGGRYEIVDKASANGIRINGVELKRGILEAGDALELGDVRMRFVGAGKIFRAGFDQSMQLSAVGTFESVAPSVQGVRAKPGGVSLGKLVEDSKRGEMAFQRLSLGANRSFGDIKAQIRGLSLEALLDPAQAEGMVKGFSRATYAIDGTAKRLRALNAEAVASGRELGDELPLGQALAEIGKSGRVGLRCGQQPRGQAHGACVGPDGVQPARHRTGRVLGPPVQPWSWLRLPCTQPVRRRHAEQPLGQQCGKRLQLALQLGEGRLSGRDGGLCRSEQGCVGCQPGLRAGTGPVQHHALQLFARCDEPQQNPGAGRHLPAGLRPQ